MELKEKIQLNNIYTDAKQSAHILINIRPFIVIWFIIWLLNFIVTIIILLSLIH